MQLYIEVLIIFGIEFRMYTYMRNFSDSFS